MYIACEPLVLYVYTIQYKIIQYKHAFKLKFNVYSFNCAKIALSFSTL